MKNNILGFVYPKNKMLIKMPAFLSPDHDSERGIYIYPCPSVRMSQSRLSFCVKVHFSGTRHERYINDTWPVDRSLVVQQDSPVKRSH